MMEETCDNKENANFETAITATGFGRFNLLLILILIPAGWANSVESSTMSYVIPAAQCDLNLKLEDNGLLNAITYLGMISSAIIWGFLFDTLGRRKLLMIGFFLDFVCVAISAFSQTKTMLMIMKFFGGFIINGPYAALSSYVSEFHSAKFRGRMQLLIAVIFGCGGTVLPWTAYAVLSYNFHYTSSSFNFHSWNIFLAIWSIPSLLSAIAFVFMPETPKFLMTVGESEKALTLFQKLYSKNSGLPRDTYPIKGLVDEIGLNKLKDDCHGGKVTAKRTQMEAIREGWQQIRPLLFLPHLPNILLVCIIQALFTMNVNTLRLWLPQIFQVLNDFTLANNGSTINLCQGLEIMQPNNGATDCSFNTDNISVYINATIVNLIVITLQLFTAFLINLVAKKKLLFIYGILGCICCYSLYFAPNTDVAVALSSIYNGLSGSAANIVMVVNLELFPTTLRTMSLALALMCGRIGSMIGNLIFPVLIEAGCAPPFFTVGSLILLASFLSLLLPRTERKHLE